MAMQDLFTALNMFKQGANELALSRAIGQANEAVTQLKAQDMSEQQQRAELQNIANGLTTRMAQIGAPATTIQAVAGAIGPKQFANGDQAILEGQLSGSQYLQGAGMAANSASKADEMAMLREQQAFQAGEAAKNRATMRAASQQKTERLRPLQTEEIKRIDAQDESFNAASDLLARVKSSPQLVGILAGRVPARGQLQPEFAAFQADLGRFFDKYRVATTGAGASEGELKMLMTRIASESDTPETFMAKMNSYVKEVEGSRARYLTNLKRAKKDVDGYPMSLGGEAPPAGDSGKMKGTPGAPDWAGFARKKQ